ncbi:MAG: IS110 family transposase [Deltaproteobacteria bacterium]|nr:MAG: IS110 family transposase [Deltaproteobacteria bacterium]
MEEYRRSTKEGKTIFVGVDLHRFKWHVTVRTEDQELFSGTLPGQWEALRQLLDRYRGDSIQVVYEAGYFGFWLHDRLATYGAECIVTPPSLLPQEYGNRVKTDRRDSRKLAHLLAKRMLKRVWVPSVQERYHRQVIRRRRQLIGDRVRTQNRIKAELRFYGMEVAEPRGPWTRGYVERLWCIRFNNPWIQESFQRLLEQYEFLSQQIAKQTQLVRQLSEIPFYEERVKILRTVPGIGVISAMELVVELQDVARFRRSDQLSAYVGLTPSQYSSAEKVRMGRITGIGKNSLRAIMVEVAWYIIRKDNSMRKKFERIKARSGSKRAIVAIARTVLLRTRRMLLDGLPYSEQLTG